MQTVIRQAFSPRTRLRCSLKGNTSTSSDDDDDDNGDNDDNGEDDAHCRNTSTSSDVDDIFLFIKRWQRAESDKHEVFSDKSSDCNGDGGYGDDDDNDVGGDDDDDGDGGRGDDDDNDVGGVGIKQVHRPHESLATLCNSFLL